MKLNIKNFGGNKYNLQLKKNPDRNISDIETLLQDFNGIRVEIDDLLSFCSDNNCSDLYIKRDEQPYISRYGRVYKVPCLPTDEIVWSNFAAKGISSERNAKYVREKMLDFAYEVLIPETSSHYKKHNSPYFRYRVSAGFSTDKNIATFRMISPELPSFNKIKFPIDVKKKIEECFKNKQGLFIVAAPTGAGKSVYIKQKVKLKDGTVKIWNDICEGDTFQCGSSVQKIYGIEKRLCFKLYTKNDSIIVSDNHLIECYIVAQSGKKIIPSFKMGDKIIRGWMKAKDIFFKKIHKCKIYNTNGTEIKYIENVGKKKCFCITTDTGTYQIGNFINHNTTTLGACINDFTKPGGLMDNSVIISLEDPIENVFQNSDTVKISQKELDRDFKEFPLGVKQALREHPTHILCGEIRDYDGISTCIEATRTGHMVMTTFHTDDVPGTIARLSNYLPDGNNGGAIFDLIANINMILCQRLTADGGKGFKLTTQYMIFNEQVKERLHSVLVEGGNIPMEMRKMMKEQSLIDAGIVKDWS